MNCTICGKPVVLVPSATKRSELYGKTPEYYTSLFPNHAQCVIDKRSAESVALMRKIANESDH